MARRLVAGAVAGLGAHLVQGDIRDAAAREDAPCPDADAVVHLAAIVGRSRLRARSRSCPTRSTWRAPCRSSPTPARFGVERFVFASTCSNYGRMADPTVPIDESGDAGPGVALRRAEGRRSRRSCSDGSGTPDSRRPACASPPSTASAPRMRFDLTVNEFTRDLWADRELEVFGEQFWRPYVHVARRRARRARRAGGAARGGGGQGLQRRPLRRELPQARPGRADHHRQARPRRRELRAPRRGPARLQGQLREGPRPSSASSRR